MSDTQTSQTDQVRSENHGTGVGLGPILRSPTLGLAAEIVDDVERVRIANENRYRQLTRSVEDTDGVERGFGLDDRHPDVLRLRHLIDILTEADEEAVKNLQRSMRTHPLGPWVKKTSGVGEKQGARLLAALGDPYWNDLHERPRTVSELWAYCGYHVLPASHDADAAQQSLAGGSNFRAGDHEALEAQSIHVPGVAAKRKKGAKANWSATAKMRAFLIAESCVKAKTSPYRKVYDDARAKYAEAVHQVPCERCGPKGKPALPGSPLNPGHQHARALRMISKTLLKDLWIESKRLHELQQAGTIYGSETRLGTSRPAA